MNTEAVQILWDAAHLWGLMALASIRGLGVPCGLVSAKDIAHGCLFRKPPKILLIPGGNARQKAAALGVAGREAIRKWLANGGVYLGFCGGAGLALEQTQPEDGLGICHWRRGAYADRLSHLISGHVLAQTKRGLLALPVWWPGRFKPAGELEILASYHGPDADLWLGDCALQGSASLPFPQGQPLAIRGSYGRGAYILSYAHLETPASPAANAWLAEILREYGVFPASNQAGEWRVGTALPAKRDVFGNACQRLQAILAHGEGRGLFYRRTAWLYGWRQGVPGMICNYLLADLDQLASLEIKNQDWQLHSALNEFLEQAEGYFQNLEPGEWAALRKDKNMFVAQRDRIFGHAMLGGGLAGNLLERLADLIIQNRNVT